MSTSPRLQVGSVALPNMLRFGLIHRLTSSGFWRISTFAGSTRIPGSRKSSSVSWSTWTPSGQPKPTARVRSGSQHWARDRLAGPGTPPFSRTGTSLTARCGRFVERSTTVCPTSIEIFSRRIPIVADQRRKGLEHLHPQPHVKVYAVARRLDRRGRQQAHRRSARDYKMQARAGSRVNRGCWSRTNIAVADRHLLISE